MLNSTPGRQITLRLMTANDHIQHIPLEALRPGPWQPRKAFNEEALQELAGSIRSHGVLTPLRVVPAHAGQGYLIVAGERRWRAAGQIGMAALPCVVMDDGVDDELLHELAILDNLHRANLLPAEEARAVADLSRLGVKQQEIALRLGKSSSWVSQRLAISRLPDIALDRLDNGTVTREEAFALTKLRDYPDLMEACLEPTGNRLKARLGAHVPSSVGPRVQAVMRLFEFERQQKDWATKMREAGHCVLEQAPKDGDRRYIKLVQGSDVARAHQKARLSCEAWAWGNNRPQRYCTDPQALQTAIAAIPSSDPWERARQEESRRILDREASRDSVIKAWLATSRGLSSTELGILARERIDAIVQIDERLLARIGRWLGAEGDRDERAELAQKELDTASERRLIQLWFLLEAAHSMSYSVVPSWLAPWLQDLGFIEPDRSDRFGGAETRQNGRYPSKGSS